jgi:type IV fimbrial biogenesis protein FimT
MSRIAVNRGFTLVELLVVIAIAAILLRMAVPSIQSVMEGSSVNKHVTTFIGDLRYARSEAIKSGMPTIMCRSANSESTAPTCAAGSPTEGWATGWIIFVDRDSSSDYSAGDSLLRVQATATDSGGIVPSATMNKFVFRPTGLLSAGMSSFTFNTTSGNNARQKLVCVSMQGRARILANSTASCNSGTNNVDS